MSGRTRATGARLWTAVLALGAVLVPRPALALTLDWGAPAWPSPTATSQTYVVGGENVVVTISDPNGVISHGSGPFSSPPSVSSSTYLDPPSNAGAPNLFLKTNGNTAAPWVEITLDFAHVGGVTGVDFSFFDVDRLNFFGFGYTDEIVVTGSDGTSTFDPLSVTPLGAAPSWTFDGTNTITGTRLVSETSENGTAQVTFDQVPNQVRIFYKNTYSGGDTQWMGLSAVRFSRAPEPSTGGLFGLGLLALAAHRARPPRR